MVLDKEAAPKGTSHKALAQEVQNEEPEIKSQPTEAILECKNWMK